MQMTRNQILFRVGLVFLFCMFFLSIYLICFYTPPLIISPETTYITSPLTKDGRVDYFRYVEEKYFPSRYATDDNGFRIFTRTFGNIIDAADMPHFYKLQKYEKLGLDITIPPTMKFPELPKNIISDYYTKLDQKPPNNIRELLSQPWTLDEIPALSDWVNTIDEPLDAIAEMIRKPIFAYPLIPEKDRSLLSIMFSELHILYQVADLYKARANYRIAKGAIDGAIDDVISIYRLGRLLEKNIYLIYNDFENVAQNIPINANPNHQLSKKQLQRLLDAIDQLPPRVALDEFCEFLRLALLEITQINTQNPSILKHFVSNYSDSKYNNILVSLPYNKNVIFLSVNETIDVAIGKKPDSNIDDYFLPPSNRTYFQNFLTPAGRAINITNILNTSAFKNSLYGITDYATFYCRIDCIINMKRLNLALLMYKAEHGNYPKADWIEKIKPYLGDNFEKCLQCPACPKHEKGKTNYALILYDKLPEDKNTIILIELNEPIPFEQAALTADETLDKFNNYIKEYKRHSNGINTARQNGKISSITKNIIENNTQLRSLLGFPPDDNPK
jgi:hypothetical protein